MRRIATAVAVLALVAGAAHAQGNGKGNDRGGGHGGGGPAASAQPRGGGNGNSNGNANPGGGGSNKDRGNARGQGGGEAHAERGNSGRDQGEHGKGNTRASDNRGQGNGNAGRGNGNTDRGHGGDSRLVVLDDDRVRGRELVRVRDFAAIPARGLVAGCPPGLAKKNPPCVPPGQVRSPFRSFDQPNFWGLRLGDGRYWYDDGYLLRLGSDGRIGGYVPLLGGALALGNLWPTFYEPVALPVYYESYYGLGPYDSYRYADNVIYRIDPETAAITSIAALLTGDDFVVGSPMPIGYDVYNVPYAYRTQYYDRPDALYRYSDGYVYQIDPETRLIASAIELLAS